MNKLMKKRPILHATLWIAFYIVLVNAGNALSDMTGVPYLAGVVLILLSAILLIYLRKNQRFIYFGLCKITGKEAHRVLLYFLLIVLALI